MVTVPTPHKTDFEGIVNQIQQAKRNIYQFANQSLIELYWSIGQIISQQVASNAWGKSIVSELAKFIIQQDPEIKGFSDKNLWRMKQFYETYRDNLKLATLWREIPWSQNRIIMTLKSEEEREFYLRLAHKERYSVRDLERQIDSSLFERTIIGNQKISAVLKDLHPKIENNFKDNYVLEFLGLPTSYTENNLQKSLVENMKHFILELGKDFIFIAEEYRIQVGNSDFFIDLLFYHRELSALVAFELKVGKFKPEHLGQLSFYLEALDRDVKKPHENPSIGVLLCSDKDDEVVEYALSRHLSPTLISQYTLILPDKKLLQAKLHEINAMLEVVE